MYLLKWRGAGWATGLEGMPERRHIGAPLGQEDGDGHFLQRRQNEGGCGALERPSRSANQKNHNGGSHKDCGHLSGPGVIADQQAILQKPEQGRRAVGPQRGDKKGCLPAGGHAAAHLAHLARERSDHTLQATALVHEAYLRLADQTRLTWKDRAHFYGIAARTSPGMVPLLSWVESKGPP